MYTFIGLFYKNLQNIWMIINFKRYFQIMDNYFHIIGSQSLYMTRFNVFNILVIAKCVLNEFRY